MIFIMALFPISSIGKVTKKNYKSMQYQLRSMEDGKWEFNPGDYYVLGHKSYSGGYYTWNLHIKWKESRSNVKRVGPSRLAQIPLENMAASHIQAQIDSIQPLVEEEAIRTMERMVDIVYPQYEEEFKELGNCISEALTYTELKTGTKYSSACLDLQMEYDAICSEIEYIHEQGNPECQMETTKRQLAYEDARLRMKELAKACFKLANLAQTEQ